MDHSPEYTAAAQRLFAGDSAPLTNPLFSIGADLLGEFAEAERLRNEAEQRWLKDLRQYRGQYEPDEEARMTGSKAFLRKTRVKVKSVDARLMDLLFPANRERNFEIEATPEPSIPEPLKKKITDLLMQQAKQNNAPPPDKDTIKAALKAAADNAAAKMATRIDDQLVQSRYRKTARAVLHSGNLFGTGILKGPLVERRSRICYAWDAEKNRFVQTEKSFASPFVSDVPIWRWYPDMAVTDLEDARYVWEHHRLSRAKLADLASRKTFDGCAIRNYINTNPFGAIRPRTYEAELRMLGEQKLLSQYANTHQYDVFERWGWIGGDVLRAAGVEVPEDRVHESFFGNLWVLPDGTVIKAVLAPIEGMTWPYHLYYLDKDETSIFGEGLAAIMRDDQKMLNAAVRMMLDNAAGTAGPMYEVYVPAFPATADITSIFPGKVFPRTGGDFQYPAIRQLNFNAHMEEHLKVMQVFDTNADETTAIPKFTYGDNPQGGAAATMGGLSMLMAQANIALKDQVVSWDEGVTKPFITALYHWNMRFSDDDTIKGDFDVSAKGAASLVAKEVRGQALAQFSATLQPEERTFVKWGRLVQQRADAMDLADVTMTDDEVRKQQADPAFQQQQQQAQAQAQLQMALAQAQVAKIQAEAARASADEMNKKLEAVYAAMQAAGVAAQNPSIAPAGDAILRSAGWQDATPQQPGTGAAMVQGGPPQGMPQGQGAVPASPHEGERDGIESEEIAL